MIKNLVIVIVIAAAGFGLYTVMQDKAAPQPAAVSDAAATGAVVAEPTVGLIDDARIISAESEPGNWLAHGRTYEEQRFSPLEQVNKESVSRLGLAWFSDMQSNRAQESTPIVVDGMPGAGSTPWMPRPVSKSGITIPRCPVPGRVKAAVTWLIAVSRSTRVKSMWPAMTAA